MNKIRVDLKALEIIGGVYGIVAGVLLHFVFAWSNNNVFVGTLSSVNESVWEHTKMIYVPVISFMLVELFFIRNLNKVLMAKVLEILSGMTFIIVFFYTYTGALGLENLFVDIMSFVVAVLLGKYVSFKLLSIKQSKIGYTFIHSLVLFFLGILFIVATFSPPEVPLFKDSASGNYGISK